MEEKFTLDRFKSMRKYKYLVSAVCMLFIIFLRPALLNIKLIPIYSESHENYGQVDVIYAAHDSTYGASFEKNTSSFFNIDTSTSVESLPADALSLEKNERVLDYDKPMIALTFDDGPHYKYTNMILDTLDEYDSKATFFVLGDRAEAQKDEVQRIVFEGHEIGNHTLSHTDLTKCEQDVIEYEVYFVDNVVYNYTGVTPALLRTPGGNLNQNILDTFDKSFIAWDVDPRDWELKDRNKITSAAIDNAKDGDIILLHDIYAETAYAVAEIVPALIEKGFQIVTVSELSEARGGLESHTRYRSFPR